MASTRHRPAAAHRPRSAGTASRSSGRSRARWWAAAAVVAVVALLTIGVSLRGPSRGPDVAADSPSGSGSESAGAARGRIEVAAAGGTDVGDRAATFEVTTTAGTSFSMPAGKPAVLFFMAGWCATCVPEATALERIHQDLGDDVAILGVSADPSDTFTAIQNFTGQAGARYGFAHDGDGALSRALQVRSLDTTIVVDAAGRIVFRDGTPTDEATLRKALAQAGAS